MSYSKLSYVIVYHLIGAVEAESTVFKDRGAYLSAKVTVLGEAEFASVASVEGLSDKCEESTIGEIDLD